MDPQTREVYETRAHEWVTRRSPQGLPLAEAFGRRTSGPTVDLGCGPGWYAPALAPPVVTVDVARSMLELTAANAPSALRVQGDLACVPFRRGAFRAAWASHSLMHIPRADLPLALAHLQWSMTVDGRILLRVPEGDDERDRHRVDDDFPGRLFTLWRPEALVDVMTGAGFDVDAVEVLDHPNRDRTIQLEAVRARSLPDVVGRDLRLLVCGLNPSLYAADAGVGFARPGNRFWPAALAAGLVSRDRDPWHARRHHRIGFTDLVKRATSGARELSAAEYRAGYARVERLVTWLQPGAVVFVGLAGWRAAVDRGAQSGVQPQPLGGRPAYVMPSTSGLNARVPLDELRDHLAAAAAVADSDARR